MTLTDTQMEQRLDNAPRKKAGDVDFDCPNCGKSLHRTLWASATEIDEDGELTYDFIHAEAKCGCGAALLIADDYESFGVYWLNKKEMTQDYTEKRSA